MRRLRKKYKRPRRPWDTERMQSEKELVKKYGLNNKKELWRTEEILRNFRRQARKLATSENEDAKKILLKKLHDLGILGKDATLDDVLVLTLESFLERRLQTLVFRKGFSKSIGQARQLVVHGHVCMEGKKATSPSFMVGKDEEKDINLTSNS